MVQTPVASQAEAAELLRKLVAIPSVAPAIEGGAGENAVADAVADFARACGAHVERHEVLPGRSNVICTLSAGAGAPTLMLEAHMDTVALGPMSRGHEPWIDDQGRLHGRGACDTKGSLAAMLLALRWAAAQSQRRCTLLLAATVDEETGSTGAKALAASGIRADGAVVGEPTSLQIVRVHRGGQHWHIATLGTAAHSSTPNRGDNAIYRMAELIQVLRTEFQRRLSGREHPLAGPSTFSAGAIRGGSSFNMVPDRCELVFERRHIPGETREQVEAELHEVLRRASDRVPGLQTEVEGPAIFGEVLDTPASAPIVRALASACERVTGSANITGASYSSDASILARGGIPSVLCGPGDIAYAHSADEWVPLDEVVQAARIYAETWRCFAGVTAGT